MAKRGGIVEKTLVILKPDAINRALVGEVIHRFEDKGLKIVAMKMEHLSEKVLDEHYSHLASKPFFPEIKKFMRRSPSILLVLEGRKVVDVVRKMAGVTEGIDAAPGTIRGDYSLSIQNTIIHASDSAEASQKEIKRFFRESEIFGWSRIDTEMIYSSSENK
ncbi:Nucleoside diphosphate kinase [uncultured archaeon]|nr:Nucleoside diphosphate kinase [uncultured archaeon]